MAQENEDFDEASIKAEPLPKKKSRIDPVTKELLLSGAKTFTIIVLVFFFLGSAVVPTMQFFGVKFVNVVGVSMEPTLQNGQNLPILAADELERGNLVVTKTPEAWVEGELVQKNNYIIKRIVALPGDVIEVEGRGLSVNGEIVTEINADAVNCQFRENETTVPEGQFFAMGDNRVGSFDSYAAWCLDDGTPYFLDQDDIVIQGEKMPFWPF